MAINRDEVLDRWAAGESTSNIAAAVGTLYNVTVQSIISEARRRGDPRANRIVKRGDGLRAQLTQSIKVARSFRRRRQLSQLAVNLDQIAAAVQAYTGPITKCPPAVHLGHRPKCLLELGL